MNTTNDINYMLRNTGEYVLIKHSIIPTLTDYANETGKLIPYDDFQDELDEWRLAAYKMLSEC